MMKDKWYKRLLCGYNPLGNIADAVCTGTETEYELDAAELLQRKIAVRCWCCTFWRGVLFGAALTTIVLGVYHVFT